MKTIPADLRRLPAFRDLSSLLSDAHSAVIHPGRDAVTLIAEDGSSGVVALSSSRRYWDFVGGRCQDGCRN